MCLRRWSTKPEATFEKRGQELANEVDRYLTGMVALHQGQEGESKVTRLGMGLYYYETEDEAEGLDQE